jgi:hypothetical protein
MAANPLAISFSALEEYATVLLNDLKVNKEFTEEEEEIIELYFLYKDENIE